MLLTLSITNVSFDQTNFPKELFNHGRLTLADILTLANRVRGRLSIGN